MSSLIRREAILAFLQRLWRGIMPWLVLLMTGTSSIYPEFSHFTRRLLIDEQQLLLRHPRRAFPLVRQRPRDERRQQDGARDRLSASRDCYLPSICVIYSSCYTSEEWCFHTYTRKVLDGWGTGHRGVLFHGNETVLFMIKIGVQTCD
jgi:hypothetical protein